VQPENKIWFRTVCIKNGLTPTDLQVEQLDQYVRLLLEWNKKINLISRKDEENVWTYHILHSISPLFKIQIANGSRIIDIGSGGGLPGIPIRILHPDILLLCLDATRKKINVISQIADELNLKNVELLWGRAEEIGLQPEYVHKFDFAIARAVGPLNELIPLSSNFLKKRNNAIAKTKKVTDGLIDPDPPAFIAFKGGDLTKEIELTKRQYPQANINSIDLTFIGSEQLIASDKKILLVHM
jgi:16S rRNA (guanine527-N7)-methyltransferase